MGEKRLQRLTPSCDRPLSHQEVKSGTAMNSEEAKLVLRLFNSNSHDSLVSIE